MYTHKFTGIRTNLQKIAEISRSIRTNLQNFEPAISDAVIFLRA